LGALDKALCPHPLTKEQEDERDIGLLQEFLTLTATPDFKAIGPVDALVVTGDISDAADPAEFHRADEAIRKIQTALGVTDHAVFFAPGNHDSHWGVQKLQSSTFWAKYRYAPIIEQELIFRRRLGSAKLADLYNEPFLAVWEHDRMDVVSINTAAFDKPDLKNHPGQISDRTIDTLHEYFFKRHWDESRIRTCLIHHHPIQYSDPRKGYPDFSIAENSQRLLKTLSDHHFDLILHGHKHIPQLTHQINNSGHPVTVLGAGSFSAALDAKWVGHAANQFHLVSIDGRDGATGALYGVVHNWAFDLTTHRWVQSPDVLRSRPRRGFGSNFTKMALKRRLESLVPGLLASEPYCEWNQLTESDPALDYADAGVVYDALQLVASQLGLRLKGDKGGSQSEWTLLKPSVGGSRG
jgi:3',5'-cyclic AMP phosphodiesterase CpdA